MKKLLFVLLLFSGIFTYGQTAGKEYTNTEFGWTIQLPDGFENVDPVVWEKLQNKGADLIERTLGADVSESVSLNKTILALKKGKFNYLEVCQRPFDAAVDGDYNEKNAMLADVMAETLKQQLPSAVVTSKITREIMGGKEFTLINIEFKVNETITFRTLMYSRLFGKKYFAVNIMYLDKADGNAMLSAFKESKFK